ncbi:MAG: phosphate butyryltransferase [Planctomycetia bacterium]|nr:phosphate butyryltransferase [Planctomycetia bacterium]
MSLPSFDELFAQADRTRPALGVAAAGAADRTVLTALREATDRGWVRPFLCGRTADVRAFGIPLDGMTLIDTDNPARAAVAEVKTGRAALLMKGQIATPALMQAVLSRDEGLRTGRVICQVVLIEIPRDQRRFLLADTGITPRPTLAQKLDILESMLSVARGLGEPAPRVAVMAASEKPTEALPDTLEAADIAAHPPSGCTVQGPLSFDLAYAAEAGERKGVGGTVTGAADVMLFPDLTSANLTVKAIMYAADCRFGGLLCGTAAPVVFMSRADSPETRLRSLALALQCGATGERSASGRAFG